MLTYTFLHYKSVGISKSYCSPYFTIYPNQYPRIEFSHLQYQRNRDKMVKMTLDEYLDCDSHTAAPNPDSSGVDRPVLGLGSLASKSAKVLATVTTDIRKEPRKAKPNGWK